LLLTAAVKPVTMKSANITRILAGLSFLIFFCPFFQMCSFDAISGTPHHEETEQKIRAEEKENTYSGYRMAGIGGPASEGFDSLTICFLILVIISAAILYFAMRGSFDNVFWFSIINMIMLTACIIIILPVYFVILIMVRYGFYLLLCNTIALVLFSHKAYKQSESYTFQKPAL
jgi:hypothetical protein